MNIQKIDIFAVKIYILLLGYISLSGADKQGHVVTPQRVDQFGRPSVHTHVPKVHHRDPDKMYYKILIEGSEYILELHPNTKLFHNNSHNLHHLSNAENGTIKNIKMKRFPKTTCHFVGTVKGHAHSKVALSNCDGLMGYILLGDDLYLVEPLRNTSTSVKDSGYPHRIYRHVMNQQNSCGVKTGKSNSRSPRRSGYKYRTRDSKVEHERGHVRRLYMETLVVLDKTLIDYHNSTDLDNYVMTCMNIMGLRKLRRNYYYSRSKKSNLMRGGRLQRLPLANVTNQAAREAHVSSPPNVEYVMPMKTASAASPQLHIEHNVPHAPHACTGRRIVDAHTALSDSTFGAPLELVVVKIIRLEAEDDELNLAVTQNAEHVLQVFQAWAEAINPPYDSHPLHHDLAILITRVDICFAGGEDCGLLGLTCLGCCCDNSLAAIVAEDNGLVLGYTIAHEIGHTVGMYHDGNKGGEDESGCPTHPYDDDYAVLMTLDVSLKMRGWSNCSREFLWAWLDAGKGECLYDDPATDTRGFNEVLPGASFGVQSQCRAKLSNEVTQCVDVAVECGNMKCYVPKYGCVETHLPLADGTECGENSWCFNGKCIDKGMRPKVIDGGWSEWDPYSSCSRTCGGGVSRSVRHCDNPSPTRGGEYCLGQRVKYHLCNTEACPYGEASYRDIQCAEFDQWVYPETNRTHTWKSATGGDENPCELVCINEEKQLAILKPQVTDGTECFIGENHICVSGLCKSVGCDQLLDSKAVEDQCGVCHGDGTTCTVVSEEKHFEKRGNTAQLITILPETSKYAIFEETSPTRSYFIVVMDKKKIVTGKKYGVTMIGPVRIWLGAPRHNQEVLKIKGHPPNEMRIMLAALEETSIKYSITTPETSAQGSYSWLHIGWTDCSEPCGPGTEISEAKCVDQERGMVEDKYCMLADKPAPLQRVCELRACESRWVIGEWLGCDCDCEDEMEERSVFCAKLSNANEMMIVYDEICPIPKPEHLRPCNCPSEKKLHRRNNYCKRRVSNIMTPVRKHNRHRSRQKGNNTILNRSHAQNVQRIKEMKGTIISDYENLNNTDLALEVDDASRRNPIPDFPKPIGNQNLVHLRGKAAVKLIQKIQESSHRNFSNT